MRKGSKGLVVLVGLLTALEIGLRLVLGLGSPPFLQKDEDIGYFFQANQKLNRFGNQIVINRYHQRSEPLSERPDSAFVRVLFVGDSVTWGGALTNQDQTYPELFERQAKQICRRPVEALNASAGSWGIGNLHAYVKRHGAFESDAAVLQIGSRDLLQAKSTSKPVGRNPAMPNTSPALAVQELWSRYLWPRYVRPHFPSFLKSSGPSPTREERVSPSKRFKENMKVLRRLISLLREKEVPVSVVHTPDRREVVAPETTGEREPYRQRFLRLLDSLQVPVLNLKNQWAERPQVGNLFRDIVHLNEVGNEQLAESLVAFLKKNGKLCAASTENEVGAQ